MKAAAEVSSSSNLKLPQTLIFAQRELIVVYVYNVIANAVSTYKVSGIELGRPSLRPFSKRLT